MKIDRDLMSDLSQWKDSKDRKPLLLKGARQTGKSWLMQEFGQRFFEHVAVFNFDRVEELSSVFEKTKDVQRILKELALFVDVPLEAGKTLIVFDEIQACEGALNALKYFCEDAPEHHVMAAGSLLGVAIRQKKMSVPVGKVQIKHVYPITFKEFLAAADAKTYQYVDALADYTEPLPEIILSKLQLEFKRYLVCGGMPEAIIALLTNKGMQSVDDVLQNILDMYNLDFSKYAPPILIPRITNVWLSLPSQLAKENRKFIYNVVRTGARAREYEDAVIWLEEAGLIHRIYNVNKPGMPLSAYQDLSSFKIFVADVGLLRRLAKLSPEVIIGGNTSYTEFKGSLAENAVLQSLLPQSDAMPYYWSSDNRAEIDFVWQKGTQIIPIEVKSDTRISGKSLSVYDNKFNPDLKICFSMNNLKYNDRLLSIPLPISDWATRIIQSYASV